MKTFKTLAVITIIALIGTSCKKQAETATSLSTVKQGKKFAAIDYFWQGTLENAYAYKYDNTGRLISVAKTNFTDYLEYPAAGKLTGTRKSNTDNSILMSFEADLNANGAIVLLKGKDKNGVLLETTNITYNSEGSLISHITQTASASYGREYVIENGKIKSGKKFNNGVQTGTEVYKIDETKENKQAFTPWGYWLSQSLFGKPLKYLITEYTEYNNASAITWQLKAAYQRDADGDVTKTTTDFLTDGSQGVENYKY